MPSYLEVSQVAHQCHWPQIGRSSLRRWWALDFPAPSPSLAASDWSALVCYQAALVSWVSLSGSGGPHSA
jgi:hypothetical protein